jgi:hypothetical protein
VDYTVRFAVSERAYAYRRLRRCATGAAPARLLRRPSVTVRNPESDAASRRFVLAMIFAPAQSGLGVICIEIGQCIKPDSPRHIDRVPAAPP